MTLYLEESAMKLFAFDIKRGCRMSIRASMKRQARLCWGRVLNTHTEGEAKEHGITRQKRVGWECAGMIKFTVHRLSSPPISYNIMNSMTLDPLIPPVSCDPDLPALAGLVLTCLGNGASEGPFGKSAGSSRRNERDEEELLA